MINQTCSLNGALPAEPSLDQRNCSRLIDSRARNKCLLFKPLNLGRICQAGLLESQPICHVIRVERDLEKRELY